MDEKMKITVDVISDVACPWCFIGMKRLEHAVALAPEVEVEIRWRPYQLDPTIPPGGLPRKEYMLNKFGSEERLREIHDRIVPLYNPQLNRWVARWGQIERPKVTPLYGPQFQTWWHTGR